jgi:hypothetical protein
MKDGAMRGSMSRAAAAPAAQHLVRCAYCTIVFDVFAAHWCEHGSARASKVCPCCARCLCAHPAYGEPHFWKEAPRAFQERGFDRLFLFYL